MGLKLQWKCVQYRMGRETLDTVENENLFQELWYKGKKINITVAQVEMGSVGV